MFFLVLLVAFAVLDVCCALGPLKPVRPPSVRRLINGRSSLESIEGEVVSWGNATTPQDAAIVPLVLSEDNLSYYTLISVGNATFRVALDTGSADLWLISSACTNSSCSVPKYQLGYPSPTFISINSNQTVFNVSFADTTTATGFIALETVQVSNLTVSAQGFGVVTSSNVSLTDSMSGILGMGFPRLSDISQAANAPPFFATLAQRGQLEYPLFGVSLTRNSSGSLTLGAVDGSVVTNITLINWNEVVPFAPFTGSASNTSTYLQWVIPLGGILVNSTGLTPIPTYPNATSNSSLALLDVGASGIFGPYQDVARIFNLLGGRIVDEAGIWALPCDTSETLTFQIGGQNYTLQPTDYLIGPTEGSPDLCLSWPQATPPSSDGIDWQLGTPFLRSVYSVFSFGIDTKEPPMIGLYPLRNATTPVETPDEVSSFFSSASATVATVLPNFVLSTPTPTTPPYAFNTSIPARVGEIVSSGLAVSTYSAVLNTRHPNATAIPTVSPSPTLVTFIITSNGQVVTSISTAASPSVTLGAPPGWSLSSGNSAPHLPVCMTAIIGVVSLSLLYITTDIFLV